MNPPDDTMLFPPIKPHGFWLWLFLVVALVIGLILTTGCEFTLYPVAEGAPERSSWTDDCKLCSVLGTCGDPNIAVARHPDWLWLKPADSNK